MWGGGVRLPVHFFAQKVFKTRGTRTSTLSSRTKHGHETYLGPRYTVSTLFKLVKTTENAVFMKK